MEKNISIYNSLYEAVEVLHKSKPLPRSYWEKEKNVFNRMLKRKDKEAMSIRMNSQKFHKSFSL